MACFCGGKRIKYRAGRGSTMANRHRVRGAGRGLVVVSTVCVAGPLLIAGCTDFKRTIGLEPTLPDEFAVESRAPLTIPPDFELRPPQPGASRPQEKSADQQAKRLIEQAGPGEPGKQASISGYAAPRTGCLTSARAAGRRPIPTRPSPIRAYRASCSATMARAMPAGRSKNARPPP